MERYRPIIDDWEAFQEAADEPPVAAVRENPLKSGEDFQERLEREFPDVERSSWNPRVHRLGREEKPGKSVLHWRGEYYVQEESAAVPVDVLDPQPGEKVLDLAAAPGGKTTQMAARMENRGEVVANDANSNRLKSLHANVYRTGSAAVRVNNHDARDFPGGGFDRVLVDAPCTAEGDRARQSFEAADRESVDGAASLQRKMMERAEELLEEGGKLVYSTCTFAPRENEGVVEHALEETGLELERIELEIPHRRGVTGFDGREFPGEVRKTVRIYPHHL
ncbi:MAG: RsmB/NOP family class I SAM-dependent RNA methyltransferase, partial [Candidatus Nanohaloarchaea archaeon]